MELDPALTGGLIGVGMLLFFFILMYSCEFYKKYKSEID
jgi:hypothetical protein